MRKTALSVIAAHLFLILFLLLSPAKRIHHPVKQLVVHTEKLRPAVKVAPPAPKSVAAAPKKVVKKTEPPAVKKEVPKKSKAAVVESGKKKVVKREPPPVAEEPVVRRKFAVPTPIQDLAVNRKEEPSPLLDFGGEGDYRDTLLSYLHESLHLPEYGEVKLSLTLRQDGTVAKMVVLKAESVKNRTYLEKTLPLLRFPQLNEGKVKEREFVLAFCNEL